MQEIPVYLFTGFMDSGKTSLISETLFENEFGKDAKTLIILCEDGDVELDEQKLAVLLNGVEDGDEVTAAADTYSYNGANVKDASTITGNSITLAGTDAGNYQLAETKISVSADILPKDLAKAEVTLGEALITNGKTQTQTVEKVMLDGTELTAKDYEVTGNQAAAAGRTPPWMNTSPHYNVYPWAIKGQDNPHLLHTSTQL